VARGGRGGRRERRRGKRAGLIRIDEERCSAA
jgi:hypothetical protein